MARDHLKVRVRNFFKFFFLSFEQTNPLKVFLSVNKFDPCSWQQVCVHQQPHFLWTLKLCLLIICSAESFKCEKVEDLKHQITAASRTDSKLSTLKCIDSCMFFSETVEHCKTMTSNSCAHCWKLAKKKKESWQRGRNGPKCGFILRGKMTTVLVVTTCKMIISRKRCNMLKHLSTNATCT